MGRLLWGCLILAVIGSLMSCVTLVRSDERAVVRRFGRILPENPGPGLWIGLPWGMDRVDRVSLKHRSVTVGWTEREVDEGLIPGQMLTGDNNLLNVQAVIEYRVLGDQVDRYVLLADRVEPLIARAAEAAMAEWLAGKEVDEALLRGKIQLESILREHVERSIVPYKLGVQIDRASITLIEPPSDVREAFNAVSKAHTNMETQKKKAEQDANRTLNRAKEKEFEIQTDTDAYVREQELAAQADVESFRIRLDKYQFLNKNNRHHLYNLWIDETARIYAQLRRSGRLDLLDHYLGADGLNITQFPLQKKR